MLKNYYANVSSATEDFYANTECVMKQHTNNKGVVIVYVLQDKNKIHPPTDHGSTYSLPDMQT